MTHRSHSTIPSFLSKSFFILQENAVSIINTWTRKEWSSMKTGTSTPSVLHKFSRYHLDLYIYFFYLISTVSISLLFIPLLSCHFSYTITSYLSLSMTSDDAWWHLKTPFCKSIYYPILAFTFEVSKQSINSKVMIYGTEKRHGRET